MDLNQLVSFITAYREQNPTGWRKWTVGSVVVVLILIVVAVCTIRAALYNKELAVLKAQLDQAKEQQKQHEFEQELTQDTVQVARHVEAATQALVRQRDVEGKIEQLHQQFDLNESLIRSIRSWDDVDRVVK